MQPLNPWVQGTPTHQPTLHVIDFSKLTKHRCTGRDISLKTQISNQHPALSLRSTHPRSVRGRRPLPDCLSLRYLSILTITDPPESHILPILRQGPTITKEEYFNNIWSHLRANTIALWREWAQFCDLISKKINAARSKNIEKINATGGKTIQKQLNATTPRPLLTLHHVPSVAGTVSRKVQS